MLIYACSKNAGKVREFALAAQELGEAKISIEPLPGIGHIPAPEETGTTFEDNARLKATYYSQFTTDLVLADDSGLAVDALNGAPGVLSARYAGPDATDEQNNLLLLRDLGEVAYRTARFICVLAVARRGQVMTTAYGSVEGEILMEPRGGNGFGYDPLFFYPPFNRSFAELSPKQKFAVSHRGKALRELFGQLLSPIT
jgi:XTP/dITP diphosphohydrolase